MNKKKTLMKKKFYYKSAYSTKKEYVEKINIVRKLLKENFDIKFISKLTGLSVSLIKKIRLENL